MSHFGAWPCRCCFKVASLGKSPLVLRLTPRLERIRHRHRQYHSRLFFCRAGALESGVAGARAQTVLRRLTRGRTNLQSCCAAHPLARAALTNQWPGESSDLSAATATATVLCARCCSVPGEEARWAGRPLQVVTATQTQQNIRTAATTQQQPRQPCRASRQPPLSGLSQQPRQPCRAPRGHDALCEFAGLAGPGASRWYPGWQEYRCRVGQVCPDGAEVKDS